MAARKRAWSEYWWRDDVSDKDLVRIGELYNDEDQEFLDDDISDEELLRMTDQPQRGSGMPLFEFDNKFIGEPAKFKNTLLKQRVRSQKKQLRDARAEDNLGEELTQAVARVAGRIVNDTGRRWPRGIRDNDQVLFNFSTPRFQHPLQSSYFRVDEVRHGSDHWNRYLQVLANQLNSNESFEADDPFDVDVTLVARGNGDGRENVGGKWEQWLGRKKLAIVLHDRRTVLEVSNDDNLCCARTIWLTKSACDTFDCLTDQEAKRYYRNIQHNPERLTRCAKYFHREAGVPKRPCGKSELAAFQTYLAPQYQLKVITACYPYELLFEGQVTEPPQYIVRLLYVPPVGNSDIGHYHGCKSYQAFLEKSYYCDLYNRGYDSEDFRHHPCEGRRCKACKQVACGSKLHPPTIYCQHCHRHFYDDRCVAFHHAEGICKCWVRCELCCKEYTPSDDPHECYTGRCRACREEVDLTAHKCYIQSVDEEEDLPMKKPASLYKKQKRKNPHAQLLKEHRKFYFMIPNGTKRLSLSYRRVQFKDSFCFIPSSLAQFSSTFGIEEIKKGFFPHTFHTPEYAIYVGALPDRKYFDPESMSEKKMSEFEEWYQEESSRQQVYDLKRELIEYCGSDVKLLKAGCQKFVAEFRAVAGFDPLEKCVTIAQACNCYWRKPVMEEESIALEPCSGWHGSRPIHSLKSLEWLIWEERQRGIHIRHARNGGEMGIRVASITHHVDGYHHES
ncbi:putative DNA polymerase [Stylophora pistillata]|uniref:DNA-directed DNA polymerase n=2 Tax=Stylophora pistillata TaxID=50429 RepID=A0A2B4R524_STYPI|nr:putative DNA polymerase [Stylophora pistillata]